MRRLRPSTTDVSSKNTFSDTKTITLKLRKGGEHQVAWKTNWSVELLKTESFLRNSLWFTCVVSNLFELCGQEKWIGNVIARGFKWQYGVCFSKTLLIESDNKKCSQSCKIMPKPCLKDLWVHSTNCRLTVIYDLSGCCKRQLESGKKQLTRLYKNVQMWGWHMAPSHSCSEM